MAFERSSGIYRLELSTTMEQRISKPAGIKEIAHDLGSSIGTVDRTLHNRQGVSPKTRAQVIKMPARDNHDAFVGT